MLSEMRENSRSTIIYVLFGILIAAFIISFGPQSGTQGGCGSSTASAAAKVAGKGISDRDWRFGYVAMGLGDTRGDEMQRARRREILMDLLIQREILAQRAIDLGFRVSDAAAEDLIGTGYVMIMGERVDFRKSLFSKEGAGHFVYKRFQRVASYYAESEHGFIEQQKKELLANYARGLLAASVVISPAEVEQVFRSEGETIAYDYVRFAPGAEEIDIEVAPAEVEAYLAAHTQEVKDQYEKDKKYSYSGLPKEVKSRHILVSVAPGAEQKLVDEAKVKAEALHKRVTGGEPFEKVAKEASDDQFTRARGGDLRWREEGKLALGEEVDKALKGAKDGFISPVVRGTDGWEIVKIERHREGDQSFDAVKLDIAQTLAVAARGKAAAKARADKAFAELLEAQKANPEATLDAVFDRPPAEGGHGTQGIPPEMLKGLPPGVQIKGIENMGKDGAPSFEITPAPTPPAGAPAAPAPVTTPVPAPAAPAPAGGSGAANPSQLSRAPWGALGSATLLAQAGAAPTIPAPPAAEDHSGHGHGAPVVTAVPGVAPPKRDPSLPKIEESDPMTREEAMQAPELGKSAETVKFLFDSVNEKQIAPKVLEAGDSYVIVYVRKKTTPDMADFDKRKEDLISQQRFTKSQAAVREWVHGSCVALREKNKIWVDKQRVAYQPEGSTAKTLVTNYKPCEATNTNSFEF